MKIVKSNLKLKKIWNRFAKVLNLTMLTVCFSIVTTVDSAIANEIGAESTEHTKHPVKGKCASIGQEITDRHHAYISAFIDENVDKLYYDFWTPAYYEFTPNFAKDRDGMRQQMTQFYDAGGKLYSYDLQSLDRYVDGDVVYDIGIYDNVGAAGNGMQFVIHGYYFLRWIKHDGAWRVDMAAAGPRGDILKVIPTIDEGPVACHNKHQFGRNAGEAAIDQEIGNRFEAYSSALASANADSLSEFWTADIHLYGQGLDLDHKGLYEYYSQFFKTGRIVTSDVRPHARFAHDNVAYEIGQSDITVVINDVQTVRKNNYVIRWKKERDGVWRIDRIMDLFRQ